MLQAVELQIGESKHDPMRWALEKGLQSVQILREPIKHALERHLACIV